MALVDEVLAQVRAEEAGTAGDEDALAWTHEGLSDGFWEEKKRRTDVGQATVEMIRRFVPSSARQVKCPV